MSMFFGIVYKRDFVLVAWHYATVTRTMPGAAHHIICIVVNWWCAHLQRESNVTSIKTGSHTTGFAQYLS